MIASRPGGDWLVRVAEWGRHAIAEDAGGRSAEAVYEIDVVGDAGAADRVLAEATRWQSANHPSLLPLVHASVSGQGHAVRVCWRAPTGSTLEEVAARHGPMPEPMVAALAIDLAAAVALAHARELVVGRLAPGNLFVAPPGSDDIAPLRVLAAGLPSMLEAAGHRIDVRDSRAFLLTYDEPGYVPPEVAAGRPWSPTADAWSLAATLARLVLGRAPCGEGAAPDAPEGGALDAGSAAALRAAAPQLGELLVRGMDPSPLARAGFIANLRTGCAAALGPEGVLRVSTVRGGGPWRMGSPVIALAAWAGSGAYGDRFRRRESRSAAAAVRLVGGDGGPTARESDDGAAAGAAPSAGRTAADPIAQARLQRALAELEAHKRASRRDGARSGRSKSEWLVWLAAALLAGALVWIARDRRPFDVVAPSTAPPQAPPRPQLAPPERRPGQSPLQGIPSRAER